MCSVCCYNSIDFSSRLQRSYLQHLAIDRRGVNMTSAGLEKFRHHLKRQRRYEFRGGNPHFPFFFCRKLVSRHRRIAARVIIYYPDIGRFCPSRPGRDKNRTIDLAFYSSFTRMRRQCERYVPANIYVHALASRRQKFKNNNGEN